MKYLRCLLVLLLLPAGTIQAQTLNKCVSGSGRVSWQSATCGQGTRQIRSIAYTPEVPSIVTTTVQAPVNTARTTRSGRTSNYRVSSRTPRARPDPCARARERRESTLERVGLKRNYDLLSSLDADVRSVCH